MCARYMEIYSRVGPARTPASMLACQFISNFLLMITVFLLTISTMLLGLKVSCRGIPIPQFRSTQLDSSVMHYRMVKLSLEYNFNNLSLLFYRWIFFKKKNSFWVSVICITVTFTTGGEVNTWKFTDSLNTFFLSLGSLGFP